MWLITTSYFVPYKMQMEREKSLTDGERERERERERESDKESESLENRELAVCIERERGDK